MDELLVLWGYCVRNRGARRVRGGDAPAPRSSSATQPHSQKVENLGENVVVRRPVVGVAAFDRLSDRQSCRSPRRSRHIPGARDASHSACGAEAARSGAGRVRGRGWMVFLLGFVWHGFCQMEASVLTRLDALQCPLRCSIAFVRSSPRVCVGGLDVPFGR